MAGITPDTHVVLGSPTRGDFAFSGYEVPEKIPFGGEQQLVEHQLVGGVRVVDAMGRSDAPLEWSGIFVGPQALLRARSLDAMRADGLPLSLTWSELAYTVVIKSFHADFERSYQIPYTISCTVVQDRTSPLAGTTISVDDTIRGDMASAQRLGAQIGDTPLSGLLDTLDSAIGSVSSFAKATQATINGVLGPVGAITGRVNTLIASSANAIANTTSIGGIMPNNPIAQQASRLTGQVTAMTQLPVLYQLQSVVGRMGSNLGSVNAPGQHAVTAGGNLYQVAASAYGDASEWTGIARANGLVDPQLTGVNTIKIPDLPEGAKGVFYP
jgi:prophage DNA circulation protein